jgi:hypothetical protein
MKWNYNIQFIMFIYNSYVNVHLIMVNIWSEYVVILRNKNKQFIIINVPSMNVV